MVGVLGLVSFRSLASPPSLPSPFSPLFLSRSFPFPPLFPPSCCPRLPSWGAFVSCSRPSRAACVCFCALVPVLARAFRVRLCRRPSFPPAAWPWWPVLGSCSSVGLGFVLGGRAFLRAGVSVLFCGAVRGFAWWSVVWLVPGRSGLWVCGFLFLWCVGVVCCVVWCASFLSASRLSWFGVFWCCSGCVSWPLVVCRVLGGLGVCAGWCVCGCVVVVSCASFSVGLAWGSSPGRCLSVVSPLGAFAPPWPVGHSVLRLLFPPPSRCSTGFRP